LGVDSGECNEDSHKRASILFSSKVNGSEVVATILAYCEQIKDCISYHFLRCDKMDILRDKHPECKTWIFLKNNNNQSTNRKVLIHSFQFTLMCFCQISSESHGLNNKTSCIKDSDKQRGKYILHVRNGAEADMKKEFLQQPISWVHHVTKDT
jgi:hypothetical protein